MEIRETKHGHQGNTQPEQRAPENASTRIKPIWFGVIQDKIDAHPGKQIGIIPSTLVFFPIDQSLVARFLCCHDFLPERFCSIQCVCAVPALGVGTAHIDYSSGLISSEYFWITSSLHGLVIRLTTIKNANPTNTQ